jgi:uncharacterized protein (DUF433 family)
MLEEERQELLKTIQKRPGTFNGKPVIRDTRLKVETILYGLANGMSHAEMMHEYDGLTEHDIQACLVYAAENVR